MRKRLSMITFCKKHCGISLLLALLFLLLINISGTYSWQSVSQQATNQAIGLVVEEEGFGSLEISKTVRNANGSVVTTYQREIEFEFTVIFGGNLPEYPEYTIIFIDGEAEVLSTGSYEFTFNLRHGETMLIENIPVGVTYLIAEIPVSGFIVPNDREGVIVGGVNAEVFKNIFRPSSPQGPRPDPPRGPRPGPSQGPSPGPPQDPRPGLTLIGGGNRPIPDMRDNANMQLWTTITILGLLGLAIVAGIAFVTREKPYVPKYLKK